MSTPASSDLSDQTPLVSTSSINPGDVPEYERGAASEVKLTSGSEPGSVAQVDPDKPNQLEIDTPNRYSAAAQAHELTHTIQNAAGGGNPVNSDPAKIKTQADVDAAYGYGGTEGLAKHFANGKTVGDLNNEQQASIPQNYMKEYVKAEKSGDAKAIDKLNKVYEPAIRQLRNMANPSKTAIDTTPDAPGAPPASVTGVAVPVKGMLSNSTKSVALKASDVHNPPDTSKTMVGKPKGLAEPGNLDITNRPVVNNADGSHSTEYSTSFNDHGKEVLLPTVVNGKFLTPDGTKPPEGSAAEKKMFQAAFQHYKQTGEHLGKFNDVKSADAYAEQLHNRGQKPVAKSGKSWYNGASALGK